MPDYDSFPPCGFDRADGLDTRPGTPTPNGAVLRSPDYTSIGFLEELAESPEIERGEQATFRHSFNVDWQSGLLIISAIGRGTIVRDSYGYLYKVLTSQLQASKPDKGVLVITSESLSFDSPPDEYDVEDIELNPEIEKHPTYFAISGNGIDINPYNTDVNGNAIAPTQITGARIVEICKQAASATAISGSNDILSQINEETVASSTTVQGVTVTAAQVRALAQQLYLRYLKGETTFYLSGFKVTWVQYFYLPQLLDGGGYIQDPVTEGGLPPYFWSTNQDVGGENTLLMGAVLSNPTIYLGGLSWLRTADKSTHSRTWFRLVRTWLGGPLGQWDKAIYPTYGP